MEAMCQCSRLDTATTVSALVISYPADQIVAAVCANENNFIYLAKASDGTIVTKHPTHIAEVTN
jgi:hypothetical protein